jgi:sodium transport system permease protein
MRLAAVIARKEILDHLRDRRSLLSSAMLTLMGPAVVFLVSLSPRVRGDEGPGVLLGMLSVFALVASFAGAADIALDSTAGERERRSMIPLLLNPVSPEEVIVGKWLAATVFGLAVVTLNIIGLAIVLASSAPSILAQRAPQLLVWIVLGLVPLASLGAAANVLVAVRSRTMKEAQNASKMLVFLPMVVGMFLVFFPGWIGQAWFLLPIVGQQVLAGVKDSAIPFDKGLILAIVTAAATIVPLAGAIRVLGREDVLSA